MGSEHNNTPERYPVYNLIGSESLFCHGSLGKLLIFFFHFHFPYLKNKKDGGQGSVPWSAQDHGYDELRWRMQMLPTPAGLQGYFIKSVIESVWVRTSGRASWEQCWNWVSMNLRDKQSALRRDWNLKGLIKDMGHVKHCSLSRTDGIVGRVWTLDYVALVMWPWNHDDSSGLSTCLRKIRIIS